MASHLSSRKPPRNRSGSGEARQGGLLPDKNIYVEKVVRMKFWKLGLTFVSYVVIAVVLGAIVGCGADGMRSVTGTVQYPDGQPLPAGGHVVFESAQGSFDAYTQDDGSYTLKAPPGDYRVLFVPPSAPLPLDANGEVLPGAQPPKPLAHPRYAAFDTSGLTYTVKDSNDNVFDIVVEKFD